MRYVLIFMLLLAVPVFAHDGPGPNNLITVNSLTIAIANVKIVSDVYGYSGKIVCPADMNYGNPCYSTFFAFEVDGIRFERYEEKSKAQSERARVIRAVHDWWAWERSDRVENEIIIPPSLEMLSLPTEGYGYVLNGVTYTKGGNFKADFVRVKKKGSVDE